MLRTLLERTTVKDILALRPGAPPEPVSEGTPLAAVLQRFAAGGHACLPVLGESGVLAGAISFEAVRHTLDSRTTLANLVVARDLAMPAATVTADASLHAALATMASYGTRDLLVVSAREAEHKVVAVLTSGDINAIYDEQLASQEQAEGGASPVARRVRGWWERVRGAFR
jgi:CBS-domain-containing membrane protein